MTLVIWLVASLVGQYVTAGLGSVNSLVAAFLLYVACGKLGLVREVGTAPSDIAISEKVRA